MPTALTTLLSSNTGTPTSSAQVSIVENGSHAAASIDRPDAVAAITICQTVGGALAAVATEPISVEGVALPPEVSANDLGVPIPSPALIKRALDVVLSALALLVLLPLFAVVAALIKLTDGGPVFFAQRRVGLRGRTFLLLKFRSMVVNADALKPRLVKQNESNGPVFKLRRDPRTTTIGRFIRKYSIDELPQLINVLAGQMSIVGPRPPVPNEVAQYETWQLRRLSVRPGLTCLWQVSPMRYQISFDEWMRLDLRYINTWSLGLDLVLILRTFGAVLGGTGV
jgi:lipopolysaccharide/colanic/teichoic acid biosynthesis glycosyltransferase